VSGAMIIARGDTVIFHYRLYLADGAEVEASGVEPVALVVGRGEFPAAIESSFVGRRNGECFEVAVSAREEAFGSYDPQNRQVLPAGEFSTTSLPEKGALVEFELPTGEAVAGRIVAVADDDVTVDFNHPLSGRDFRYQIEILAAHPPGVEQQTNYG